MDDQDFHIIGTVDRPDWAARLFPLGVLSDDGRQFSREGFRLDPDADLLLDAGPDSRPAIGWITKLWRMADALYVAGRFLAPGDRDKATAALAAGATPQLSILSDPIVDNDVDEAAGTITTIFRGGLIEAVLLTPLPPAFPQQALHIYPPLTPGRSVRS